MPKASIVIPVHNRANLLPATLDSVKAQTFTDWECIIVDDHSTDGSAGVAEAYARNDRRFVVIKLPDFLRSAARLVGGLQRGWARFKEWKSGSEN